MRETLGFQFQPVSRRGLTLTTAAECRPLLELKNAGVIVAVVLCPVMEEAVVRRPSELQSHCEIVLVHT